MHIHKELKKSMFIFKSIDIHDPDERIFSGWGSVEIIDKQGDLIPIKEFEPVMKILMRRGAPIVDSHSNHKVGKIISYEFRNNEDGERGLYLTAKIYKDYPTDDQVWEGIINRDYTGFSLGGKAGEKIPICNQEGCYNVVKDIEAWEFSVVEKPANQKSLIDHVNKLAKSDEIIQYIVKNGYIMQKPFAGYENFDECVAQNHDKDNTEAYCGTIKYRVEKVNDKYIVKTRRYIKNPSEAPWGVKVEHGKKGGYYYETGMKTKPKKDKPKPKVSEKPKPKVSEKPKPKKDKPKPKVSEHKINPIPTKVLEDISWDTIENRPIEDGRNTIKLESNKALKRIGKYLGESKVYQFPYSMRGANGFTIPRVKDMIFIPDYDINYIKHITDNPSGIKTYTNKLLEQSPDNKQLKKLNTEIQHLSIADTLERTIMHEKAHLDTFDFFENKLGDRNPYNTPDKFFELMKPYMELTDINEGTIPTNKNKNQVIMEILEYIAEDRRLMFEDTLQSRFPHRYLMDEDMWDSNYKTKRIGMLKDIFGWN